MPISLTYFSHLIASEGYGRGSELHLLSLLGEGADVFVRPTGDWSALEVSDMAYKLIHRPRQPTRWGVIHEWPPTTWGVGDCRWHLGITMIEGTRAPDWFVQAVNRHVVAVGVPCRQNVEALVESGVTRPVYLIPYGLDDGYEWGDKTRGRPVTFGTLGTLTPRKGTDILLRCFTRAFPKGTEDVRLEVKARGPFDLPVLDPRISVLRGEWSVRECRSWYHTLTAYVSPTRGEGFGLTIAEAMRCGCAVIATDWSGPADFLKPGYSLPLAVKSMRPTRRDWPEGPDFGDWAVPDEDHLIHLLRAVAERPQETRALGVEASRAILEQYPLSTPGRGILDAIGDFG